MSAITLPRLQHIIGSGIVAAVGVAVCYIGYTQSPSEAFLFPRLISTVFVVLALWTFVKANPGKLTFSGAGLVVGHHIAALQLEQAAGVDLAYIPNNAGGAGAMRAVIAGEVLGGVNNLSDAFRAREAGTVKILGVFDLERNAFMEDVPTMMEQGYDIDNASVNFRGVMVPAGTDQAIIDHLAAVVPAMFENGRVARRMEAGGSPMHIMNREEVLEMWAARQATLEALLADL